MIVCTIYVDLFQNNSDELTQLPGFNWQRGAGGMRRGTGAWRTLVNRALVNRTRIVLKLFPVLEDEYDPLEHPAHHARVGQDLVKIA